jgi:glycosyltransferase involved in cell wall biosynthesis
MTESISILIPACNEAQTLADFLPGLVKQSGVSEVLVVNDGSTDETARVAQAAGARVISHPRRRGNGAAVKTGLRQAKNPVVLIMDADGQHTWEDVASLLAEDPSLDLVIGARPFHWYRFRDFGNLLLSHVAAAMTGEPVDDLTSGLRRIRRDLALRFWHLYPEGFSFPTTSAILFLTSGYLVKFVPIPNRPRPPHASASKLRPLYEGTRFLSMIYRIVLLSHPLRFFAPLGVGLLMAGIAWTLRTFRMTAQVSAGGALLFLSGLTLLLFGTIADQLSQIRRTLARADSE